jgi:hypothetical protein
MSNTPQIHKVYIPIVYTPTPPPAPPNRRGMAGVVWTEDNHEATRRVVDSCGWFHNWTAAGSIDGLEFVPFLWGWRWPSDHDLIGRAVDVLGADYAGDLLWLNEPADGEPQANMTPHEAVHFYRMTREALPHARLIGPNMSFITAEKWEHDANWLRDFVNIATAENIALDFAGMAVHNYAPTYEEHIRLHGEWVTLLARLGFGHLPLWVTEWGVDYRNEGAAERVRLLCRFYDNSPTVYRHAWYIHHAWAGDTFPIKSYLHNGNELTEAGRGWLNGE